jgi:hypothetical protein
MSKIQSLSVMFLFAAASCFGQPNCNTNPFVSSRLPACRPIQQPFDSSPFLKFMASSGLLNPFAPLNIAIADARSRYWKAFVRGHESPQFRASQEYKEAEAAFLGGLRAKDMFNLMFSSMQGVTGEMQKMNEILNIDDGIRPYAKPLYSEWVNALRRAEGRDKDGQYGQLQILAEANLDNSNWRVAYEDARNWIEVLSSGLDLAKYYQPDGYMINQMEADVAFMLGRAKPADLPNPKIAAADFYRYFEDNFGKDNVQTAAAAVLRTPKNSIGGLATRAEVNIGAYLSAPSPNPYLLFLTKLANSSPRNYAIALCMMDPNGMLITGHPTEAFNSRAEWEKALSVYRQLTDRFGEAAVTKAAGRLKDVPKDDRGGPQGDPEAKGAIYWFTSLLKDPNLQLPESAHFLAGSYDPRWVGKVVQVRGTVSRVELDTTGSPRYATIHFKESKNDRFTAFTPNPEILDAYGQNSSGLTGKAVEVWGTVQDWHEGSGIRVLIAKQLQVLDAGALANFRESTPAWMKQQPASAPSLVDSPKYLAWKKFPPGSKARYANDLLHEYKPGTNQYTKTRISQLTLTLESIDDDRAIVKTESTISGKIAGRNGPDTSSSDQLIIKAKQAPPGAPVADPSRIITNGEETLTINGKQIATRWELVTRADDPLTFTKTWTSDDVPGGLVRTQQQTHSLITGEIYRDIQQTLYAPLDGVEPQLGTPGRGARR